MIKAGEAGNPPGENEFEVVLFGPGYGESIVLHIGFGSWVIVDSCINDAGKPRALEYLESIGVNPAQGVELIVATHWHDDHIRGMAKLVEVCSKANFCCANALRTEEFLAAIDALEGQVGLTEPSAGPEANFYRVRCRPARFGCGARSARRGSGISKPLVRPVVSVP